jgi:hypothetical protein
MVGVYKIAYEYPRLPIDIDEPYVDSLFLMALLPLVRSLSIWRREEKVVAQHKQPYIHMILASTPCLHSVSFPPTTQMNALMKEDFICILFRFRTLPSLPT